jgi:hypothetical protein
MRNFIKVKQEVLSDPRIGIYDGFNISKPLSVGMAVSSL